MKNLATHYNLTSKEINIIIDISESTASLVFEDKATISETSKEGQLALLLIRQYKSLNSIFGNELTKANTCLTTHNIIFDALPLEYIKLTDGLTDVVKYQESVGPNYIYPK